MGEAAPDRLEDWKLLKSTTRAKFTVDFPEHLPIGTIVWLMARWGNYMCEWGPCSHPAGTSINLAGPSGRSRLQSVRRAA